LDKAADAVNVMALHIFQHDLCDESCAFGEHCRLAQLE